MATAAYTTEQRTYAHDASRQDRALATRHVCCVRVAVQIIKKPGIVIRGAGMTHTTLYLNKSLTNLYGNDWCAAAHIQTHSAGNNCDTRAVVCAARVATVAHVPLLQSHVWVHGCCKTTQHGNLRHYACALLYLVPFSLDIWAVDFCQII